MIAEKADWVVGDRYPPAAMKALYAETPLPKSTWTVLWIGYILEYMKKW
jgi:hypothetical protein